MKTRNKVILGGFTAGAVIAGAAAGVGAVMAGRRAISVLREVSQWGADDLRGQTVLVTGSSRGLGLALAEEFARNGCKLVLCARNERELLRARQRVERLGAEVHAMTCDISKPEQVDHLVTSARQHFGRIDLLVNNAGTIFVGPLLSHELEDFRESMDTIFWGMVHPTLAVLPAMIERGRGKIVNITSVGGKVSMPHLLPYSCAKFATVGFSEGLHTELKKYGVNVVTVVPGLMRTGSHLHARFKGHHSREYSWFALGGTNPLLSMSVERAARKIVNATRRNQAEVVVGWQARALIRGHSVAPGLAMRVLAFANTLLPAAQGGGPVKKGHESESAITRSPLTALGRRAARRFNQTEEIA
jgi:short-subunit dehydrogenase